MLGYKNNFDDLEKIYTERYGVEMFGDYDKYFSYKKELEKKRYLERLKNKKQFFFLVK